MQGLTGSLSQDLLDYLTLSDDFLKKPPPKSTGRERYGAQYKEKLCEKARELDLQLADVIRTATGMVCGVSHAGVCVQVCQLGVVSVCGAIGVLWKCR